MEEAGEKGSVRSSGGGGSGRGVLWEMDVEVVMALRTLESVEKDACALSNSLSALLASLESALSKVYQSSFNPFFFFFFFFPFYRGRPPSQHPEFSSSRSLQAPSSICRFTTKDPAVCKRLVRVSWAFVVYVMSSCILLWIKRTWKL